MKYIYGPVPSRRLGLSLGIDIIPPKHCTLSCIYCQLGKTPHITIEHHEYIPAEKVLEELKELLHRGVKTDWITFAGSGEPTLHSGLGSMIRNVKSLTDIPVCVITNGTLLWDPCVQKELLGADAVLPSLDSAVEQTFQDICHPHRDLSIVEIIDGLVQFRKEYSGKILLEILFVKGLNDSQKELEHLRDAVKKIKPDEVHLNTVVRPPAENSAEPLSREQLEEIRDYFGKNTVIIAEFKTDSARHAHAGINEIKEYLKRRPGSLVDISTALGINENEAKKMLERLTECGEVVRRNYLRKDYWEYPGKS
ncbi:radical SAM protein [Candidatus Latescibacterota bacterium]